MTLLRLIESTLPVSLSDSLDRHAARLRSEGWRVEDRFAVRTKDAAADVRQVKTLIHEWLAENPARPHVFVIGDLPMPRSGIDQNPDGHENTAGAYPCPAYWVTSDAGWTDQRSNTRPVKPTYLNLPGDSVWDQDTIPEAPLAAIGILNLKPGSSATWLAGTARTWWTHEAYRRWFALNHDWRRGAIEPRTRFGCARNTPNPPEFWLEQTTRDQSLYKLDTVETGAPFGAFFDTKGLPPNGTFWFQRRQPLAAFYLTYESYQTAYPCSRLVNALMTGSVCAAPLGPLWNLEGWQTKTVGELWQQTARPGQSAALALYGDPTFGVR